MDFDETSVDLSSDKREDANNQFTGLTDTKAYLPGIGEAASSPGLVTPSYYHADQIGSLRLATDGTGHVIGRYVYSAFGEMILEDGGAANTAPLWTRYRFGGAWQYETGLGADETGNDPLPFIRIGHRWYDPGSGRFLQRDPIGIEGGLNVYSYCGNQPTIEIDSDGLGPIQWFDELWPKGSYSIPDGLGGGKTFIRVGDRAIIQYIYHSKGKAHGGIATPHTHVYCATVGPDGSIRPSRAGTLPGPPPPGGPPPTARDKAFKAVGRLIRTMGGIARVITAIPQPFLLECSCGQYMYGHCPRCPI